MFVWERTLERASINYLEVRAFDRIGRYTRHGSVARNDCSLHHVAEETVIVCVVAEVVFLITRIC